MAREVLQNCQIQNHNLSFLCCFPNLVSGGSTESFKAFTMRRLDTQRQIQEAVMVYKSLHGFAPNYLSSLFTQRNIS